MRLLHALQILATFAHLASSIPQYDPALTELPRDLTESILKHTESRHDLRDAALAVLQRRRSLPKRPVAEKRRYSWYTYVPIPRPGITARDETSQIAQLLAQLEQSFATLAQLISAELGIPIASAPPPAPSSTSQTISTLCTPQATHSLRPILPIITSPQPLTTSQPPVMTLQTSTVTNTPSPSVSQGPASSYIFNPNRDDLNVVYYAQSPATTSVPFLNVCNDPSVDIIVLSFITDFFSAGGYPTLNLASKCWGLDPNTALGAAAKAKGATGLIDCISPGFAAEVAQCQAKGKKVMLSLGGSKDYSNTFIPSEQKATELANTLWSLFLAGTDPNLTPLRPFGNVVLDGIDIDNEQPSNSIHIPTLVSTLHNLFQTSRSLGLTKKPFYLSASPQCPRPDLSVPTASLLPYLDFLWVQFYNNPSCNLGTSGFLPSLQAWSADIANSQQHARMNGMTATGPRLFIGAPANPAAAGAGGYVDLMAWKTILGQVKNLKLGNLGGAMYWDGSYLELQKTKGGGSMADVVRSVL